VHRKEVNRQAQREVTRMAKTVIVYSAPG
jgi:hypothetical protein